VGATAFVITQHEQQQQQQHWAAGPAACHEEGGGRIKEAHQARLRHQQVCLPSFVLIGFGWGLQLS